MIFEHFKKNLGFYILLFLIFLIVLINYRPGMYLSGWDTLHPEFDFPLNFKRLIFGVWRQEQGLGAIAAHSHMADLPRVFILWLFHFFFPLQALRYLYLALCLLLGPIGIYVLVQYLLKDKRISFLAGLFYLLNLSTVQQFYVPFEIFPTQYAFLPWIIFSSLVFLEKGKKYLILFAAVTIFSTPQAYAAHLWYPFFGMYVLFLFLYWVFHGKTKPLLKNVILLIILTLSLNSFWLLPNFYYIKTSSRVPKEAKQNRIFSQEYRLRNREHGYLKDVALVRGFYFSWNIYDPKNARFTGLMQEWQKHLNNPLVISLGYLFFGISIFGMAMAFLKKHKILTALFPFFAISFIFLMNHTFPFDIFFDFLLRISLFEEAARFIFNKFSVLLIFSYVLYFSLGIKYLLRLVDNKIFLYSLVSVFTVLLIIFSYPVFQGNLISAKMFINLPTEYFSFWNFMKNRGDGKVLTLPLHTFSGWQYYNFGYQGAGFIWFGLPQAVLERDFDRWSVSNEQAFREFHYALYSQNSRAFKDNLEKYNISYIVWDNNVITTDLKNRKQILFERETDQLLSNLVKNGIINELKSFGNIKIYKTLSASPTADLKKINHNVTNPYRWNYVDFAYSDLGNYISLGKNSVTANLTNHYYIWRNFITSTDRVEKNLIEVDETDSYLLKLKLPATNMGLKYTDIVAYWDAENSIYTNVFVKKDKDDKFYQLEFAPILPGFTSDKIISQTPIPIEGSSIEISINGKEFTIVDEAISNDAPLYLGQVLLYTGQTNYLNDKPLNLKYPNFEAPTEESRIFSKFPLEKNVVSSEQIFDLASASTGVSYSWADKSVRFKGKNTITGVTVELTGLPHSFGYFLIFESRNIAGLPIRVCLKNLFSNLCNIYDELSKSESFTRDFFVVAPIDQNVGYSLSLDTISYGDYDSINEIKQVTILPFPYNYLSQIKLNDKDIQSLPVDEIAVSSQVIASNPFQYSLQIDTLKSEFKNNFVVLNQSYHAGWAAYVIKDDPSGLKRFIRTTLPFLYGENLKEHVLVNNWANAWRIGQNQPRLNRGQLNRLKSVEISKKQNVVIIFWPQYLEFLGFGLLLIALLFVIRIRNN